MTSEELTTRLRQVDPEFPRELRAAAADLIESQQARIDELEAERLAVIDVLNIYGDSLLHRNLTDSGLLLAASPDTPETRP